MGMKTITSTVYVSPLIRRMLQDPDAARQLVLGKTPFVIKFEGKKYEVKGSHDAGVHHR
jgi:hypothetical protein